MRFLEKPEEPVKGHGARNSREARRERARNGSERHLAHPSSSRQPTPALSTITSRSVGSGTKVTRPQEARSKSQNSSWGPGDRGISSESCYDPMPGKSSFLPPRDHLGSAKQAASVRGSKTPECVLEELIRTGVLSGTEFLSRLEHHREQPSAVIDTNNHTPDPTEASKPHPQKRVSYEDRGVMVSPGMEKSERSTVDLNHQGTAAGTSLSTKPSTSGKQSENPSMSSGGPNRVEVTGSLDTSETCNRLDSWEANKVSSVGKHPKSISETSEGGHHYIRSANQGLDLGIGQESSLWKDRPSVQPLPQRLSTPQCWEHVPGNPRQYGWQRYQDTQALPSDFGTRCQESLYPRISTLTPIQTPHPTRQEPLNYEQGGPIANKKDPGVLIRYSEEETMMEFIKRTEKEVMARWDQAQDSYEVAMSGNDFEGNEITRSTLRNSQLLPRQREPGVQRHQGSFVDWDNPVNAPRRFSGRTATDEDCAAAEAEMLAFWKPNRL